MKIEIKQTEEKKYSIPGIFCDKKGYDGRLWLVNKENNDGTFNGTIIREDGNNVFKYVEEIVNIKPFKGSVTLAN